MKKLSAIVVFLFVLALAGCSFAAPQVDTAADKATIEKLYPAWVYAVNAKDIEAWASFLAADARFQPPNGPALTTHEEIVNLYKGFFEDPRFTLDCQQQQVEVADSGEMAWSRGICEGVLTGQDGEENRLKTKWLKVWQKQPNGEWKNLENIWNSDLPTAE